MKKSIQMMGAAVLVLMMAAGCKNSASNNGGIAGNPEPPAPLLPTRLTRFRV